MALIGNISKRITSLLLSIVTLLSLNACQSFNPNLEIYCFQAGKADAFLITTKNHTILLDTGESDLSDDILDYLQQKGIEVIDAMIITHFDKDHVGSAGNILKNMDVGIVYQSNYPKDSNEYEKYLKFLQKKEVGTITVEDDIVFTFDSVTFKINGPDKEEYEKNPSNNSSLIVSIIDGDCSYLFMGDSEDERIEEFIAETDQNYDFIKIPYHGHQQDSLEDLLENTNPSYALITSSDDEKEDEETLDLLTSLNIKTYLTRENAVLIQSDGNKIQIQYRDA